MEIFRGQNLIEFAERFKSDDDCKNICQELSGKMGLYAENVVIQSIKSEKTIPEHVIFVVIPNLQWQTLFSIK